MCARAKDVTRRVRGRAAKWAAAISDSSKGTACGRAAPELLSEADVEHVPGSGPGQCRVPREVAAPGVGLRVDVLAHAPVASRGGASDRSGGWCNGWGRVVCSGEVRGQVRRGERQGAQWSSHAVGGAVAASGTERNEGGFRGQGMAMAASARAWTASVRLLKTTVRGGASRLLNLGWASTPAS